MLEIAVYHLLTGYILPAAVIPLVGGALLAAAFRIAKITEFSFKKCWLIYLSVFAYGFLGMLAGNFVISGQQMTRVGMILTLVVIYWVAQAISIPLVTRSFSRRSLLAQEGAVFVTNVLLLAVVLGFFLANHE